MNHIWLIRHGECHSNTGEKTTHPAASMLTERGILQSESVADCIDFQPDSIIHSPYIRTLQSAQPTINKFPGVNVDEWAVQEFIYLPHEAYRDSTQGERRTAVDEYWNESNPQQKNSAEAESFIEFIDRMEMVGPAIEIQQGPRYRFYTWPCDQSDDMENNNRQAGKR